MLRVLHFDVSRKKVAAILFTVLLGVVLFIPALQGSCSLSNYYVDPIKNWSFETDPSDANRGWQGSLVAGCGRCWLWTRSASKHIEKDYSWYTKPLAEAGEHVIYQDVGSDNINALKGQKVKFTFWFFPESPPRSIRAEIRYKSGGAYTYVYGDWVQGEGSQWYLAPVTADLPSTTTEVRVIIRGGSDFKGWVDYASLSICDSAVTVSTQGHVSLSVNLFEYRVVGGMTYDGRVLMSVGLAAESTADYEWIRTTKLMVELLPIDNGATSQDGQLGIEYVEQTNEEGYDVDPAENEELRNTGVTTAQNALWLIATTATALYAVPGGPLVKFLVSSAVKGVSYSMNAFRCNPDEREAYGGSDYAVWEEWWYPVCLDANEHVPDEFVDMASGYYELEWIFKTSSASNFRIRITASVNWGTLAFSNPNWWIVDDGWSHATTEVEIIA